MDRIRFGVIIFVVFSIAFATCAAGAAKLKVPAEGTYLYWIDYTDGGGKAQVTDPAKFKGKATELDLALLGDKYSGSQITVLDLETGNAAVKPLDSVAKGKDLAMTADDFKLVRNVELNITSKDGDPIESAMVTITDADNKKQTQVLDPTLLGTVRFSNVAGGQVTVDAVYEGRKKTWDIEVPLDRETPVYSDNLKIAGKVSTVEMPKAEGEDGGKAVVDPKAAKKVEAKAKASYGPLLLLNTLLGILLLGIIVVVVILVLRSRGVTTASALRQLGVQFPQDTQVSETSVSAPPAPEVDPTMCPFCGQKKDASGNCACSVLGTPAPAASTSAAGAEPRLIGTQGAYAGSIFPITVDNTTIGREETNLIPLPLDTTSSRRHAVISRTNGSFTIRDEGSSNGTFVNGARISAAQPLKPGDEVQIGSSRFRFETS